MPLFNDSEQSSQSSNLEPWKIAIIDDESGVHDVTILTLKRFNFERRGVTFLSAHSGEEGLALFKAHPDIALAFVDVVMETDDAGLKLIDKIRNELNNHSTRLILRTGQPGQAPEEDVIRQYDINDYKAKTELSSLKLKSCVYTAIRSYRDITTIEKSKQGMEDVLRSSSSVLESQSLSQFGSAVLKQLLTLLNLNSSVLYLSTQHTDLYGDTKMTVLGASGDLLSLCTPGISAEIPKPIAEEVKKVLQSQTHFQSEKRFIGYYPTSKASHNILYIELDGPLDDLQRKTLEMFASNVAVIFQNLTQKEDIQQTQKELIMVLSDAIEMRSKETGGHVKRVILMTELLSEKLFMSREFIDTIRYAAALHDVGKISIPEAILHKPGKLNDEEWEVMKTHAQKGYELLSGTDRIVAKMGAVIAKTHHEKWDGSGYPDGLAGDDIPIEGRIMAIVDVVDALLSKRCYKSPWGVEEVKTYIKENAGKQFDPIITQVLLENFDQILALRELAPDEDE
jgi:response regulator RpfG family c-di-GMP phosphodiesterase